MLILSRRPGQEIVFPALGIKLRLLLDAWMPRRDGQATLQAIRSDERLRGLKVFSISSTTPDEQGVGSGPGGFDAWFPKPLDPVKLWQTMQQQLADSVN